MNIRTARAEDAVPITRIALESQAYYRLLLPDFLNEQSFDEWLERFLLSLSTENYSIFVAESDTNPPEILGYIELFLRQTQSLLIKPRMRLVVDNVAVRADLRRQRIGESLLRFAEEFGRQKGADRIELEVAEGNSGAIALYQKLGFSARTHIFEKKLG